MRETEKAEGLEGMARSFVAKAKGEGRDSLTDLEGLRLLEATGVERPFHHFVRDDREALGVVEAATGRVVVKVVSPEILHKTEVGGVAIVDVGAQGPEGVAASVRDMMARFSSMRVEGYTINEFISYEPRIGHEMIVGYRFAPDFGPVVSFGPGGIFAEYLATSFRQGSANAFFSPATADRALVERTLADNAVCVLASGGLRNTAPAIPLGPIVDTVLRFLEAAPSLARAGVSEFEVNPFVITGTRDGSSARLVALDILAKLGDIVGTEIGVDASGRLVNLAQALRPVAKIDRILEPRSAAVIGVSEKGMNNGRIILNNLIHDGFDRKRLYVVKPGLAEIDGCACVPDVASLPEKVDLFVLVIPARDAAPTITALAELDKAESVIVIPGGLEEKGGTEALVATMRKAIAASRERGSGGPLINGGNCLGIRSVPGRYNTLFIPEYKLPLPQGDFAPVALLSQSGAFAICRVSKHPLVNPKYIITAGNQMDLTVGDYLERLARDRGIELFAVYVEGFKPLDGEKTLRAVRDIVASGRTVVFYRAGRTAAGAAASASHTASIAGDWPVTKALLEGVGAVVASSLDDFDDAVTVFCLLRGKKAPEVGRPARLGAVSNAGFECVAFADNLGALELASISEGTRPRLERIFAEARVSEIVDIHNPIDLTPMAGDRAYEESLRALLDDPGVDCGIVGIVPLTGMMNSLAPGPLSKGEDVGRDDALPARYGALMAETEKPWVAVVDSGQLYDPLARGLEARGVPTFRTADRALAMLNIWIAAKRRK